jgi:phage-related protein
MTDTTQASTSAAAPAATNAIDTFFANIKKDWQVFEGDVIAVCQNIEAGIEVAAEDLTYSLSWLGSHIGQVAQTVSAVQGSVTALTAAGITIPASLAQGIAQVNDAVAGVNAALNNQAVSANASVALTDGYKATKALQVAAASAAGLAAAVQSTAAPPAAQG